MCQEAGRSGDRVPEAGAGQLPRRCPIAPSSSARSRYSSDVWATRNDPGPNSSGVPQADEQRDIGGERENRGLAPGCRPRSSAGRAAPAGLPRSRPAASAGPSSSSSGSGGPMVRNIDFGAGVRRDDVRRDARLRSARCCSRSVRGRGSAGSSSARSCISASSSLSMAEIAVLGRRGMRGAAGGAQPHAQVAARRDRQPAVGRLAVDQELRADRVGVGRRRRRRCPAPRRPRTACRPGSLPPRAAARRRRPAPPGCPSRRTRPGRRAGRPGPSSESAAARSRSASTARRPARRASRRRCAGRR